MFVGFNFDLPPTEWMPDTLEIGKTLFKNQRLRITEKLEPFTKKDGRINASELQANWFPQVNADIFISHSHKTEHDAIGLAGWLKKHLNLTAFIDSCAWGYAGNLLQIIDANGTCNNAASHVHMMLATALTMMIDKTECVFFLNRPESITIQDVVGNGQTQSPWLYYEIATTHLIRQKSPDEHRYMKKFASIQEEVREEKNLDFTYHVNLSHLINLNKNELLRWEQVYKADLPGNALDSLYKLKIKKTASGVLYG